MPRPIRSISSCFPSAVNSGKPVESLSGPVAVIDICLAKKYPSVPNIPRRNATSVTDSRTTCDQSQQIGAQGGNWQTTSAETRASGRECSQDHVTWTRQSEADGREGVGRSVSREGAQRAAEVRARHLRRATFSCRRNGRRRGEGPFGLPRSAAWLVLRARRRVSGSETSKTDWRG